MGNFSTSFTLAVAIWPVLSALLTLPILAGMYHRHHRLHATSVLTSYICVLYALGLVTFTLYPMPDNPASYCLTHAHSPQLNPMRFLQDLATGGKSAFLQLALNVVLFIPLGFALTRWARWNPIVVIPVGFMVSALIETSQLTGVWGIYPCAYRQFDVDDLLTNTLGAAIGCLVAWIYGVFVPNRELSDSNEINMQPGFLHRAVTMIIDLIFVWVVTFALTFGFIHIFQEAATPLSTGEFVLLGHTFTTGVYDGVARLASAVSFLIFELWIPAVHGGQTLGGMFTHMSVETKSRSGGRRAMFYILRALALFAATQLYPTSWSKAGALIAVVLVVFYVLARRMPYDMV